MKHVIAGILALATVFGLVYGTTAYIESRNEAIQLAAVGALKQYEITQKIKYLLHLLEAYDYRINRAFTSQEKRTWTQKREEVIRQLEQLKRVR